MYKKLKNARRDVKRTSNSAATITGRRSAATRTQMLQEIETFLATNLKK